MGNSWCAWVNKSDYLNDKEKRKEQLKRLQKIMDYDFNKGFISDITVEEIIKHYGEIFCLICHIRIKLCA